MATITGTIGPDRLTGTAAKDLLRGLAGNDSLFGLLGNDTLDGGLGIDIMTGAAGNDIYVVDNVGDKAIERAGGGIDLVRASVSFTLGGNVENLVAVGAVELKLVSTVSTLDNVGPIAGVPHEHIIPVAHEGGVGAAIAVDSVVARAAEERVISIGAEQLVVAVAAIDHEVDKLSQSFTSGKQIVSTERVHDEMLGRAHVHVDVAEIAEKSHAVVRQW